LRNRLQALEWVVAQAMLAGPHNLSVPGGDAHDALVMELCRAAFAWGHSHAREELRAKRRGVAFNEPAPTPVGPIPVEAIAWAQARVALQGKWQRDLDSQVIAVIVNGLETGATNQQVMDALERVFPSFSKPRLENIARTESIAAYNQGKMVAYRANPYAEAVQFAAILDTRTTKICQERDGLIMRLDDERMQANTPPLHFQCRSTLVPLDKWDMEDLQASDPDAEARFFGWLQDGPRSLREALNWDALPNPLPGFGNISDVGR